MGARMTTCLRPKIAGELAAKSGLVVSWLENFQTFSIPTGQVTVYPGISRDRARGGICHCAGAVAADELRFVEIGRVADGSSLAVREPQRGGVHLGVYAFFRIQQSGRRAAASPAAGVRPFFFELASDRLGAWRVGHRSIASIRSHRRWAHDSPDPAMCERAIGDVARGKRYRWIVMRRRGVALIFKNRSARGALGLENSVAADRHFPDKVFANGPALIHDAVGCRDRMLPWPA